VGGAFKALFGKTAPPPAPEAAAPASEPPQMQARWLPDVENTWGVPMVDVRPITQGLTSMSSDPQCASNAVSFGGDDGRSFRGQEPETTRVIDCYVELPTDGLFDGVLFVPTVMEEKWALYIHDRRLLCIRSWTRNVVATAGVSVEGGVARFGPIRGMLTGEGEPAEFARRVLAFLLRSHALNEAVPAPLPGSPPDGELNGAAMWCFTMFGRRALFASSHVPRETIPARPLRSDSLLHIAAARGDTALAEEQLKAGVPPGLLARDGLPVLQWSLAAKDGAMPGWLLDHGCDVNGRSDQGATALMTAAQNPQLEQIELLLSRGASVNAMDHRGFTALHRAAERGAEDVVKLLLSCGADASIVAEDQTARSLAEKRGHAAVLALLA
jgi:hypothetical protein